MSRCPIVFISADRIADAVIFVSSALVIMVLIMDCKLDPDLSALEAYFTIYDIAA